MVESQNFFDYLREKGLRYPVETVENFLLSLKAKQFVILSGGSGTGKTKLAQAYGEFITMYCEEPMVIPMQVTLNKLVTNHGFSLSTAAFFKHFPKEATMCQGNGYTMILDDCKIPGRVDLNPRFFYSIDSQSENDKFVATVNRLKEDAKARLGSDGKDGEKLKADCSIIVPSGSSRREYVVVPVGSNWTESRFITGYTNAITGKYVSTPSLDVMVAADADKLHAHILILDEMNLSHVERYFSDVLSAMESGEPINLDGNTPASITIGNNMFIIGTVNQDETTYAFSPKVLDRANVIEFSAPSVSGMISESSIVYDPKGDIAYLQNCETGLDVRDRSASSLAKEMLAASNRTVIETLDGDLSQLQSILSGMGFPIGFRTVDEIMRFMYSAWVYERKGEFTNWRRYFDAQIMQKLLPKIHGNQSIRPSLDEMRKFCESMGYRTSREKIEQMIAVLDRQRYVSFNI